jgi:transcription initiation factor IIE alpha subunit
VFGDESTKVISAISKPLEDKDISAKLDFETSKVRTILNDLLEKNLVHLTRDRLDTGYCHYSWVRRDDKIIDYLNRSVDERMSSLDEKLRMQEEIVFECGCKTVDYAKAIESEFSCQDCMKKYTPVQPGKGSRKIQAELKRLSALMSAA